MEMIILIIMMVLLFWFMSRGARKTQQRQIEQRNEALVVGNNVVTQAGFLGRVVDIDGDAVTLESPSGEESVWLRTAIVAQMDIPLGDSGEDTDGYVADESDDLPQPGSGRITNTSPFVDDDGNPTSQK